MVKQRMWVGILAAGLAVTGCSDNPATGGRNFSLVSSAHEREIGQASAEAALKQYGLYKPGSAVTNYVTNLCQTMFAVTEVGQEPISCILLDSDTFNAWATPGYINVYRGFIPFVNSEAQLAAVLGHEAGHLAARHIARGQTQQILTGLAVTALGLYVSSEVESDGAARLALQAGSLAAGFSLAKFSRDHEREADELAQRYLPRAGYDPREAVGMVEGMRAYEAYMNQFVVALRGDEAGQDNLLDRLTSSHPPTPERIASATQRFGAPDGSVRLPEGVTPATANNDPQGRERFLRAIDGLEFGPQKNWGIAGRTYIALPKARAVVRIPDGFVVKYMEMGVGDDGVENPDIGQWWGRHPQSDVRFKMGVDTYKAGMNVGVLLEKLGVDNAERLQLADGTVAYTGVKTNLTNSMRYRALAIPSVATDKVVVMVFNFPDAATQEHEEAAIMQTLVQSKLVSEDKVARWKPLKIDIQTVATGTTQESLAARMPVGALRDELFRAMNGLEPGQPLPLGSKVKMLVDVNQL